jgi:hypothetical protein
MRKTGLVYSFLIRALYYEDEVLDAIRDTVHLEQLFLNFYKWYESCMNRRPNEGTTYNLHMFAHSLEQRNGPSWTVSAETFESAYFVMKKLFAAGTRNITKQLLQKYLIRDLVRHRCHINAHLAIDTKEDVKAAEDNSILSVTHEDGKNIFVRVHEKHNDNHSFTVSKLHVDEFNTENVLGITLAWDLVGIQKYYGESKDTQVLIF